MANAARLVEMNREPNIDFFVLVSGSKVLVPADGAHRSPNCQYVDRLGTIEIGAYNADHSVFLGKANYCWQGCKEKTCPSIIYKEE